MKNYKLKQWHLFEVKDQHFVFIPENLRLYSVEKEVFDRLQALQAEYGYKDSFECDDKDYPLLEELSEEEIIDRIDADGSDPDEETRHSTIDKFLSKYYQSPLIVTSLVLQLANDCNLNCLYCYGDGGSYGRKRELMKFETAQKAIDMMVDNCGEKKELCVVFFGGEPLLNFKVIKQIVSYCKEIEKSSDKKFMYSMTTNGTIMNDEIFNFIKDNKVAAMISMDGDKGIQDCYRCYENGRGSYDTVVNNIGKFKEARGGYLSVRATACKPNLNLLKIRTDLKNLGFSRVNISIVDTRKDSPLFVGPEDKETVTNSFLEIAEDYIKEVKANQSVDNEFFTEVFKDLYFKNTKLQNCSAGKNGFAIGTDGNIYPCQRFMGMEDYKVGTIENGIDKSLADIYRKANIMLKEDCKECWARHLCGGGCSHTCVSQENDIMKAPKCYCDTYKGMFEIILYTYYVLKTWNKDFFSKMFEKPTEKAAS